MHTRLSLKSLAKAYALGIVWFSVMLSSSTILMAAVSDQFAPSSLPISTAATLIAVVTVALAMVVATAVTGGLVVALRHLHVARPQEDLSRG